MTNINVFRQYQAELVDPRPFRIFRTRRGAPRWYQPLYEAWLVLTKRCTLHRAWQAGYDHGHLMEINRQMAGGQ